MRKQAEYTLLQLTTLLKPNTGNLQIPSTEQPQTRLTSPIISPTFNARTTQPSNTITQTYEDGSILLGSFTGSQLYFHAINRPTDRDDPTSIENNTDLTIYYTRSQDGTVTFGYEKLRPGDSSPYEVKYHIPVSDDHIAEAFALFDLYCAQ